MRNSEGTRRSFFYLAFQNFLQGEGKSFRRPSGKRHEYFSAEAGYWAIRVHYWRRERQIIQLARKP
jgi:hypothetical protein